MDQDHDWITIGINEPNRRGLMTVNYRCAKCGDTESNVPPDKFPKLGGCRG